MNRGAGGIMLSKISQVDDYCVVSLLCEILKKKWGERKEVQLIETVERWWPGAGRWGQEGEVGKRERTFICKTNDVGGSNVQRGDCSWYYCVV